MYDDVESEMNKFDPDDIQDAILGPIDEKNKLEAAYQRLREMFVGIDKNAPSEVWQSKLEDEIVRNEFKRNISTARPTASRRNRPALRIR